MKFKGKLHNEYGEPQGEELLLPPRVNTAVLQNSRHRNMGLTAFYKRGELHIRDGTVTPAIKARNGASAQH